MELPPPNTGGTGLREHRNTELVQSIFREMLSLCRPLQTTILEVPQQFQIYRLILRFQILGDVELPGN